MALFVTATSIAGLDADASAAIIAEAEAKAIALVPCLASVTDPDLLAVVGSILTRVVTEWVREAGKVAAQTAGPWSITYVKAAVLAGSFSAADLEWLRRLSGCDAPSGVVPLGQFPPPRDLSGIFEGASAPVPAPQRAASVTAAHPTWR